MIYISHITRDNFDIEVYFKQITTLTEVYVQDQNDSTQFIQYNITAPPTITPNSLITIPVLVNGTQMFFIFDTGASVISISNIEASFLFKQGKLTEEDVKDTAQFSDANGDISVGTIINLKEITIGNKTLHNVEASVVNNSKAQLLFGQSALESFGKISIDYNKGVLIFD